MAEATPAMQKRQRSAGALIARQESQREHRRKRQVRPQPPPHPTPLPIEDEMMAAAQALEDWAEAEAEL